MSFLISLKAIVFGQAGCHDFMAPQSCMVTTAMDTEPSWKGTIIITQRSDNCK